MSGVVTAFASPSSSLYSLRNQSEPRRLRRRFIVPSRNSSAAFFAPKKIVPPLTFTFTCSSSSGPGDPTPAGENESKNIIDAFFLGKALAEAVNERIESTVGEFLSTLGRLQAEQQKQVQDFQEDVLERAKRAKERAARETKEIQGHNPNSSAADTVRARGDVTLTTTASASGNETSPQTNITVDSDNGNKES